MSFRSEISGTLEKGRLEFCSIRQRSTRKTIRVASFAIVGRVLENGVTEPEMVYRVLCVEFGVSNVSVGIIFFRSVNYVSALLRISSIFIGRKIYRR